MFSCEQKCIDWLLKRREVLLVLVITVIGGLARLSGRGFISVDARDYLLPWFDTIQQNGGLAALSEQVGNYNVFYQFLIALMTYLPFPSLYMYKGLSMVFDIVLAAAVGWMVWRLGQRRSKPAAVLAYAAVFLLPATILNLGFWAQCDSIYTSFIVLALVCLFFDRPLSAFVLLGVGFAFKLQSIFILPFFVIYYLLRRKCSVLHFLIIPAVMMASAVPGYLAGRPLWEPFDIYLNQTETYSWMNANFPNVWCLFGSDYALLQKLAIWLTIAALGMGLFFLLHLRTRLETALEFLAVAAWSVWTCLMFLPSMHERYGYLLDILLLVRMFLQHDMWKFPAITITASTMTYKIYLISELINMAALAVVCLAAYFYFTYTLAKLLLAQRARQESPCTVPVKG